MPDYTARPLSFKVKKALRYTRMYGVRRTLSIIRGQYNMKRTYATPPAIPAVSASQPALCPISSITMTRRCASAVE